MSIVKDVARVCAGRPGISGILLIGAACLVGAGWLAVHSPSREVTIAVDVGPVHLAFKLGETCPHDREGRANRLPR